MQGKLTVADLIAGIGAIVTLLFSFFDVFDVWGGSNAWNRQAAFIVLVIPPLVAIAMVVLIALRLSGNELTGLVVTFTIDQIKAIIAVFASLVMIFLLISDTGGASWEFGFWLMLLGSLAMAAGTIMTLLGAGTQLVGASTSGGATQDQAPPPPANGTPPPQPPGGGATPPPPPGGGAPPPPPGGGTPPPPPAP